MNQEAFLTLFTPVQDKMYRFALRLLSSKEAAQDAVQEVMTKLWNKRERIKGYTNPQAFAMTMTKNYCLDQLKLKQNNTMRIVHSNYEDQGRNPAAIAEVKDELDFVRKIMDQLPEQQQMVLQLRDIEQQEFKEIAEVLEMSETAIRVTLSRARKKIREELLKVHRYGIA
ncbi:sigma-70 family RNA polymerase sigma factor [Gangjinia marincola]|uniref:Sigma-70 family RNA polymerase sigma factor n=1 Tax=Gangjinia marincola TaxID=578463 RepID=A0ABN1MFJ7_9FLAO